MLIFVTFWFVMSYVEGAVTTVRLLIAIDLQSFHIRFVRLFPLLPLQVRFIESCCRLVVAVMLVCAACPVMLLSVPIA
jgi:hypothetical protein